MLGLRRFVAGCAALLLFAAPLMGQDPVAELVKRAPSAADYPEDDGVILLEKRVLDLSQDGSLTDTYTRVFRIFTQVGLSAYADPRFLYWNGREQIEAVRARTFMADGRVVPVPENGYHDMVWSAVATAPDWLDLHQYVIDHTALEKGAVIDLEVRRTGPVELRASGVERLQTRFPILKRIFEVRVPEGAHFEYRTWPESVEPEIRQEGNKKIFVWQRENVPPLPPRNWWDRGKDRAFRVEYSFVDWHSWAKKVFSKIEAAENLSPAVRDSLAEALSGKGRGVAAVRAVRKWVNENVRTVRVETAFQTLQLRPASRVFDTRYGSDLEKAVFLAAALGSAEIPASLALSGPAELVDETRACPAALTDVWVVAHLGDRDVWVDPTGDVTRQGVKRAGKRALVFGKEKYSWKIFQKGDAGSNKLVLTLKLRVKKVGSVGGEGTVVARGLYAADFDLLTVSERRAVLSDWLAGSVGRGSVELGDVRLVREDAAELGFSFELEDSLRTAGGLQVLRLGDQWPAPPGTEVPVAEPARGAWIELPCPLSVDEVVEVEFPRGWSVQHLPASWKTQNDVGLSTGRAKELAQGGIQLSRTLEISEARVEPEEVAGYMRLVNSGRQLSQRTVVFAGQRQTEGHTTQRATERRRYPPRRRAHP